MKKLTLQIASNSYETVLVNEKGDCFIITHTETNKDLLNFLVSGVEKEPINQSINKNIANYQHA